MAPRSATIQNSAETKKWLPKDITPDHLVIQDKVYDISKFGDEHPGGRVIYSYAGQDATDPFRVFHAGSSKSYDVLAKYCVGELSEPIQKVSEFEQEMRKLTAKFQTMGLFKANKLLYFINFLFNASLVIVPALVCIYSDSFAYKMIGAIVMALGFTQFGWSAHEYGHHQIFRDHNLNDIVLLLCCTFIGFDREWWSLKHNLHHAVPNVHETVVDAHDGDPDIDTLPFLAWSKKLARKVLSGGSDDTLFARFCVRHQHWVYFPLLLFARMTWVFQSFAYVFRVETSWGVVAPDTSGVQSLMKKASSSSVKDIKLRYEGLERLTIVTHLAWYFGLLAFSMDIKTAICFFFLNQMFTGLCMAIVFGVGHNGMMVYDTEKRPGFAELQITTTRNVIDTPIVGWFMGGLHYQIEHHLFPTMPRHSMRYAAPAVKELCKKYNVPYRTTSLWDGTMEVLVHLKNVAKEMNDGPM